MKRFFALLLIAAMLPVLAVSTKASAAYYPDTALLYEGVQNSNVSDLQQDLKYVGYFNYGVTGYFGANTRQAVINFQRDTGLTIDGMVGHQTARMLKSIKVSVIGKQYLGVPYVWGGTTPAGFDCSGFTGYVFQKEGISLPRSAAAQFNVGVAVSKDALKPGDLVFFTTYKPGPSHVGIYMGEGKFINASSSRGITICELNNVYYAQRYIGARRVIL